jgi:hypothetical protein
MPARKIMPGLADTSHAVLFLISQGWQTPEAVSAVEQWQDGSGSELDAWVTSLPLQAFQVEGGIVHWRNHARGDPALRWWSALWLFKLGRYGEADKELEAAISNGAPLERCLQLRSAIRIVSNPALEKRDGARSSTNLLLTKLGLSQAPHNGFEA